MRLLIFLMVLVQSFPSWAQNLAQLDSIEEANERLYFANQTSRRQLWLGVGFGMGMGIRSNSVVIGSSTALLDINASPSVSVFLAERWLLGINYDLYVSVANFGYESQYRVLLQTVSPSVRYYYRARGVFSEVKYGWGYGSERFDENHVLEERTFSGNRLSVGMGFGNFWMSHVNFELLLKYTRYDGNYRSQQERVLLNGLNFTAGINIHLGKW
jgi:hypothetical protein